ncbi:hypothetical protein H4R20_003009 [Coemansia guatemalensis]|uniref:Uncharacterized protein n=1 Tax=Coemansia guatemalensis TaxID=2761395 RepID=A0A9W8LTF8_9FUNG|nr:hypothetical protein H4R20_003009 [Coemansia guatemalensis]
MRLGVTLAVLCVLAHVGLSAKCLPKAPSPTDVVVAPTGDDATTDPTTDPTLDPTVDPNTEIVGNDDALSESSSDAEASTEDDSQDSSSSDAFKITLDQLDIAVPLGKGEGQCGASDAKGCVLNSKAVDPINKALAKYKITRRSEVVAVLALMAFESGSWKYNINVSKNQPGQGTFAMMQYPNVYAYAKYLYPSKVEDKWATLEADTNEDPDSEQMNKVREMVLNDDDSFGSGFWFLTNKVEGDYHNNDKKLRDGNPDDFKAYCLDGVQTGWDDTRNTVWEAVNKAIK